MRNRCDARRGEIAHRSGDNSPDGVPCGLKRNPRERFRLKRELRAVKSDKRTAVLSRPDDIPVRDVGWLPPVSRVAPVPQIKAVGRTVAVSHHHRAEFRTAGLPGERVKQIETSAADVSRNLRFRLCGEIRTAAAAQHDTAFFTIADGEADTVEKTGSGLQHPQVVVGALIGPAALAVIRNVVTQTHVHGGGKIKRRAFRSFAANPDRCAGGERLFRFADKRNADFKRRTVFVAAVVLNQNLKSAGKNPTSRAVGQTQLFAVTAEQTRLFLRIQLDGKENLFSACDDGASLPFIGGKQEIKHARTERSLRIKRRAEGIAPLPVTGLRKFAAGNSEGRFRQTQFDLCAPLIELDRVKEPPFGTALAVAAPLRCESDEFEFMLAEPQSSRAVELNVFRENRDGASEKRKNPFQLHVQSSGFQFLSDSRMNL